MLTKMRGRLVRALGGAMREATVPVMRVGPGGLRAMPGQALERARYLFAPTPAAAEYLVQYALVAWVYAAVDRLSEMFAQAALEVWKVSEATKADSHGLLRLLGPAGRPNVDQDRYEFLKAHVSDYLLSGNSYWNWWTERGGAPTQVYRLEPECMFVVPGAAETVGGYVHRWQGKDTYFQKEQITHFRNYNPFSRYYGLSALEALRIEVRSDRSMAEWNEQFFGHDVFSPAGILVVDETVGDAEKERLEADLEGKHGPRRRTAVVRSRPGGTVWVDAGLRHRELDFKDGRMLSRQAVYEALGLPLALMSETSTEALARVAERQMTNRVHGLHRMTEIRLESDGLAFWPGASRYRVRFEDVRVVDWQMEKLKLEALRPFMTVNEIREKHLMLSRIEGGDKLGAPKGAQGEGRDESASAVSGK